MKKLLLTCSIAIWAFILAHATGDSLQYLRPQDTLFVQAYGPGLLSFTHYYTKGQTLYSLAAHYGLKLDMLYTFNPSLRNKPTLPEGQPITIPLPVSAVIKYQNAEFDLAHCAPLFYQVKKGDTFYGLAKRQFQIDMDTLLQRNGLTTTLLSPGTVLHIGWLSILGIPDSLQTNNLCGLPMPMGKYCLQFYLSKSAQKLKTQRGAAYWLRDLPEIKDPIAMHREAPIGSIVHLYNPRNRREAFARVIGRIDSRLYTDEIIIILSPAVANALDTKDAKFFVELEYFSP